MKADGMEFFCYHRDRPGSEALRGELLEEHWASPRTDPDRVRAVLTPSRYAAVEVHDWESGGRR